MSGDEQKLLETAGEYCYAVRDGQQVTDPSWQSCQLLLTNKRLVLAGSDGKRTVPHAKVVMPGDAEEVVPEDIDTTGAVTLRIGSTVVVVAATGVEDFVDTYCRANLGGGVILAKHPAVVGGVVQGTEWQRGRLKVTDETVRAVLEDGGKLVIDRGDIGEMETDERDIAGERRGVIEVEHTNDEGTSVQTYLSGREYHIGVLKQLLEEGAEANRADLDLSATEQRVVMALYSGVSPFGISEFVGTDVERVEEIYDQLIELDVIEEVRTRKEVSLTPQGRKIAGEAMGEQ
jgi:helix-turn-helix protein